MNHQFTTFGSFLEPQLKRQKIKETWIDPFQTISQQKVETTVTQTEKNTMSKYAFDFSQRSKDEDMTPSHFRDNLSSSFQLRNHTHGFSVPVVDPIPAATQTLFGWTRPKEAPIIPICINSASGRGPKFQSSRQVSHPALGDPSVNKSQDDLVEDLNKNSKAFYAQDFKLSLLGKRSRDEDEEEEKPQEKMKKKKEQPAFDVSQFAEDADADSTEFKLNLFDIKDVKCKGELNLKEVTNFLTKDKFHTEYGTFGENLTLDEYIQEEPVNAAAIKLLIAINLNRKGEKLRSEGAPFRASMIHGLNKTYIKKHFARICEITREEE